VLAQTLTRWELIIVDDGSPDASAAVAESLIASNPGRNIRLLRQANAGPAHARNAAIRAGSAPYILPLDADDTIAPEMLARTLPLLESHPEAGFVYTDVIWFGDEERVNRPGPHNPARLAINNYLTCHALMRRAAWEQAGGYCGREILAGFEDWDLWLSIVDLGWQGVYLPAPLVGYRRRNTGRLLDDHRRDLELRAMLILRHQRLYPHAFAAWAARYLGRASTRGAWARAFAGYAALIARHRPQELPKTLGRPLLVSLSARQQGMLRRAAQIVLDRAR
jgi:glycosyltransferase involved in cell wall biosynthesis